MRSAISCIYNRGTFLYKPVNKSSGMGTRSYEDRNRDSYAPTGIMRPDLLEWAAANSVLNDGIRGLVGELCGNFEIGAFEAVDVVRSWLSFGKCVEIDGVVVVRNGKARRTLIRMVCEYKKQLAIENERKQKEDRSKTPEVNRHKGRFAAGPWSC